MDTTKSSCCVPGTGLINLASNLDDLGRIFFIETFLGTVGCKACGDWAPAGCAVACQ